jgi:transcription elongation factor GreA
MAATAQAMQKVPMTQGGFESLEVELKQLKHTDRQEVIKQIAEAREHGDLSENAEYHAARERQSFIEGRILELEDKISRAEVIDPSKLSGKQIKFGATVSLIDEDTEEKVVYQIVGEFEADISKRKISITSPVARALIGKAAGASVEVVTPRGSKVYEITKVQYK